MSMRNRPHGRGFPVWVAFVFVAAAVLFGCRAVVVLAHPTGAATASTGTAGPQPPAPAGVASVGSAPAAVGSSLAAGESPGGPDLLWVWPPDTGGPELSADQQAAPYHGMDVYFRFATAPPEGSLALSVEPQVPYRVYYCGEMVVAYLYQLQPDQVYEVALFEGSSGVRLAGTRVISPRQVPRPSPSVDVSEGRDRDYRGYRGLAGPTLMGVNDGDITTVGFGDVVVDIWLKKIVSEKTLRAAIAPVPPEVTYNYVSGYGTWTVLQVRWPGVAASGPALVDPAAVVRSGRAPAGFALEMTLTVDASAVPAFAGLAGRDGEFRLRLVRKTPPDFTVASRDDSRVGLPYPADRDIFSLAPQPHRLRITFNKAMDRASVERSLVAANHGNMDNETPGNLVWSFDWLDERTLDVTIEPSAWTDLPALARICPEGASDQDGLTVWFTDYLAIRWQRPRELVRVPAANPPAAPEALGLAPAGVVPLVLASDGKDLLGLESARKTDSWPPTPSFLWWYHPGTSGGRWIDCSTLVEPFQRASWLDSKRALLIRSNEWEIYRPGSGQRNPVELDAANYRWLGFAPDPAGTRIAGLRSELSESDGPRRIDLVVFDLDGREQATRTGVMSLGPAEFHLGWIPFAWLPSGDGLVVVDRRPSGVSRLVKLDLASGALTPIPGTDRADRNQGDVLAVFDATVGGRRLTCCSAVVRAADGGWGALKVLDVSTGAEVANVPFGDQMAPGPFERSLPSPDGSRLALVGPGRTVVLDFASGLPATMQGRAVGWSPDGKWLYLALGSDFEAGAPPPFPEEGFSAPMMTSPDSASPDPGEPLGSSGTPSRPARPSHPRLLQSPLHLARAGCSL